MSAGLAALSHHEYAVGIDASHYCVAFYEYVLSTVMAKGGAEGLCYYVLYPFIAE